jgi:hypothetical protein
MSTISMDGNRDRMRSTEGGTSQNTNTSDGSEADSGDTTHLAEFHTARVATHCVGFILVCLSTGSAPED